MTSVALGENVAVIHVKIHGSSGHASVTFDGSTPTVDGDDTSRIDAGAVLEFKSSGSVTQETVKIISASALGYSVEAFDQ